MNGVTKSIGSLVKPRREKASPSDHPDLHYIGLEHIEAHTTKLLGSVPATEMRSTANQFFSGDVLYSRLRPYLNKVWYADRDGLCSSEFIVMPGNESVDANFLRYRLNSADFVSFANRLNAGDRPRVDFDQISIFKTWLPKTLEQQRRIVAEIEKQFTRLEAGVAALKRVQANLKRYRAAVLKAACEGKLVPTEVERLRAEGKNLKNLENGEQLLKRILAERRKNWTGRGKYKEPAAPGIADLPPLPEGWTWATLDQLCSKVTDGTHLKPIYTEKGVPFLSVKNVRPGKIFDTDIKFISAEQHADYVRRCKPEKGDILYTKVGVTFGFAAINTLDYEFSIYVSLALLKYPQHLIAPKYIELCMNSLLIYLQAQKRIKGIGRPDLHLEEIREFHFPLPPMIEQTRIVAEVERRLSVVEELEAVVSANLQRSIRLRQSILQKAFDGQLC
ncbi:MAG: restriction endonuclease subunit S [Verrucomicrobiae bacterium]|nr:restriction endonuclease subunit S [Verrucomicrobiae bacterium]